MKQNPRGLPRSMLSYSGNVFGDSEKVVSPDGSEMLRVRIKGERRGEPEQMAVSKLPFVNLDKQFGSLVEIA